MDDDLKSSLVKFLDEYHKEDFAGAKMLNSNAFVTVIGGLIITGLSLFFQKNMEEAKLRRERDAKFEMRMHDAMSSFSDEIILSMNHLQDLRPRGIHLYNENAAKRKAEKDEKPPYKREPFRGDKSFLETQQKWRERRQANLRIRQPDASIALAKNIFRDKGTLQALTDLDHLFDRVMKTKKEKEFWSLLREADADFQETLLIMGEEYKSRFDEH